jgi:hypothetical protein
MVLVAALLIIPAAGGGGRLGASGSRWVVARGALVLRLLIACRRRVDGVAPLGWLGWLGWLAGWLAAQG